MIQSVQQFYTIVQATSASLPSPLRPFFILHKVSSLSLRTCTLFQKAKKHPISATTGSILYLTNKNNAVVQYSSRALLILSAFLKLHSTKNKCVRAFCHFKEQFCQAFPLPSFVHKKTCQFQGRVSIIDAIDQRRKRALFRIKSCFDATKVLFKSIASLAASFDSSTAALLGGTLVEFESIVFSGTNLQKLYKKLDSLPQLAIEQIEKHQKTVEKIASSLNNTFSNKDFFKECSKNINTTIKTILHAKSKIDTSIQAFDKAAEVTKEILFHSKLKDKISPHENNTYMHPPCRDNANSRFYSTDQ